MCPVAVAPPSSHLRAYRARLRRVLAHIDANLDGDLSLDRLSAVAGCSKYHLHRQFSSLFGLGVHRYVQLARLKRASFTLAFRRPARVLDVALASGYESGEAFARAFKRAVGVTPTSFRARPRWAPCDAAWRPLRTLRREHMRPTPRLGDVAVVEFPETRVAELVHRGEHERVLETVQRFIGWRRRHRLPPSVSATYNIVYDDPDETPPEAHRFGICAAYDGEVAPNPEGVAAGVIAGGRCARLRHVGSDDTLPDTVRFLYGAWLPASGEALRDAPLFFQRVRSFPDAPEHEAVTDVFLPLR